MQKRIICIISGRVQGVLYRATTRDAANRLGVKGEVENLPDKTVWVEGEGEEEKLKQFETELWNGSMFSKVENVVCDSYEDLKGYEDFKIKRINFWDRF